jgi:glycosyltransferase involved in cell wall biosynthesis
LDPAVRICLAYETLFPYFHGGAERWYRGLAERLAAAGHEVTYVTMRRWPTSEPAAVEGVRIVTVGPPVPLYAGERRRISLTLRFGSALLRHLLREGQRYDAVHTAALQLSVLAAAAARRRHRYRLIVDWFEVWTPEYWREYLGPVLGRIAYAAQRRSARVRHEAICFSRLHERRLREQGFRGEITRVEGIYTGPLDLQPTLDPEPLVVTLGRQIPEKRVAALVPALALARRHVPALRAELFGDGPDRDAVLLAIEQHGLGGAVEAPGIVGDQRVYAALAHALCLAHPTRREGYGLVVVEAAAHGTPSVIVESEDNAALELVSDGENGVVAQSADPEELAAAIVRVHAAGRALRESTAAWFARNAHRLSLEGSIERVLQLYVR